MQENLLVFKVQQKYKDSLEKKLEIIFIKKELISLLI